VLVWARHIETVIAKARLLASCTVFFTLVPGLFCLIRSTAVDFRATRLLEAIEQKKGATVLPVAPQLTVDLENELAC
jgi:hypothetical protein